MENPAFSPDGKYLFVNSQLFVLETGEQIGDFGQNVGSFSHDSRFLATGIAVWNLDHGQLVWEQPPIVSRYLVSISGLAFSPDDRFFWSCRRRKAS